MKSVSHSGPVPLNVGLCGGRCFRGGQYYMGYLISSPAVLLSCLSIYSTVLAPDATWAIFQIKALESLIV